MNRREALKRAVLLMGGTIYAPAIVGVLGGCSAKKAAGWKPQILSQAQAALVDEVAEIIIPRTETPGARDVGVTAFIDTLLTVVYSMDGRTRYLSGLEAFDAAAKTAFGKPFLALDSVRRAAYVQKTHDVAAASETGTAQPLGSPHRPFILTTKELTLLGFFTSQPGATQVLQYEAIPGQFHACVPLSQAGQGRAWAE